MIIDWINWKPLFPFQNWLPIDHRLDQLEANFEKEKEAIENSSLSKDAKKAKVKALKNKYKQEKERLKNERDTAIKSGVWEK